MNIKTKDGIKKGVTNCFGAIGYLFCFLQWFWAVLLYFSIIQSVALFLTPKASHHTVSSVAISNGSSPNLFLIIFGVIVAVVVMALSIYIFIKLPLTIAKTGKKIVHQTAVSVAPRIIKAQKKPKTKKFHIQLTAKLILILKLLLIIIPIILAFASRFLGKQVFDFELALYAALILAGLSFVSFTFQYLLALLLSVKKQNVS